MSRNVEKDLSVSLETEQLLSGHICGDTPGTHTRPQFAGRWSTDLQCGISSSRPTPRDKSTGLSRNAPVADEPSGNPVAVITPPSIIVNGIEQNDNPPPYAAIPPPYSAIAPPNHVGWPYGFFSSDSSYSTDAPPYRVEPPLAPFQTSLTPSTMDTGFYPEGTNGQHASLPVPLTPYRFFKFGSRTNLALRGTSDNGITEKINDRKSRKYGAIFVAAAVIIFLMALSIMVRFVMEKSWWRR